MTMNIRKLSGLLLLFLLQSCGSAPSASLPISGPAVVSMQQGKASYYGTRHHGRKTASGERFNKNALTAAHRTLPFGSLVRVTNLANQQSIVVRINDRGPYAKGRIIDLSEQAARELNMIRAGVGNVKIEQLK
ncbi:septal ring lytic transglycosylase RlpA family protein [Oceanisphaera avium]|uniref:Endolytic peptidoglycan transglycosylase RlpA n=1 Tax=Oceanisphaera avium TaxID=1903694 RepID=A0A1Y0CUG8_9GAMM|nr:septal ring lytic transglycosylase RlpA family protein [Oceanisphaera avium]ART78990.1 septal ring lytic transglycosylase RlpA family lipoprotein [Oceanisphaera avium]